MYLKRSSWLNTYKKPKHKVGVDFSINVIGRRGMLSSVGSSCKAKVIESSNTSTQLREVQQTHECNSLSVGNEWKHGKERSLGRKTCCCFSCTWCPLI